MLLLYLPSLLLLKIAFSEQKSEKITVIRLARRTCLVDRVVSGVALECSRRSDQDMLDT